MTESQESIYATHIINFAKVLVTQVDIEDLDTITTAVLWRALEMQLQTQGLDIEMLLMARDGS